MDLRQRLESALAGRYRVVREIGRGGMAIVYLAHDLRHDRDVALKALRPEVAASLGPERFLREIKLAASLSHPHILPLHDSGDARGCLFYVMPYVQGESLRDLLIREGRLSVGDAVGIAREVADALAYAHYAGVVHRDVKPGNILLQAGHAVVSDFGIARAIRVAETEKVTATGLAIGTREYMSPEQAYGDSDIDGRADIYGLGCVLYEMLVGRPPSGGTTPGGRHIPGERDIRNGLGAVRPPIPPQVSEAIVRALAESPVDRFANAAEFDAALAGTRAPRLPRWLRMPSRRVLLGVGVVALLGIGAWLAIRVPRGPVPAALDPTHVAVLYFDDLSPDGSLAPVAAGLTEDLIDQLGGVRALTVTSPNGVRPYRGRSVPPDSIARALSVGTIATGSVSRAGGLLRVSVRLIDGATGQLLHASRPLVRPFVDLFALQDSLTADIAGYLRERIGEGVVLRVRRAGTSSVAAWELVQRADALREDARALIRSGDDQESTASLSRADSLYRQAEALDRRWVVPVVAQGRVAQVMADQIAEARPLKDARAAAREPLPARLHFEDEWIRVGLVDAERALALQPDEPDALELRGSLRYLWWLRGYVVSPDSLAAAERDLRTVVTAVPSLARGWYRLSQLLRFTGRFAEAQQTAQRALEADAFLAEARPVYSTLYFAALNLGHYDDARAWCRRARSRFPTDLEFAHCELRILGWSGRGNGAIAQARRLVDSLEAGRPDATSGTFPADRRLLLAAVYARSGEADSARSLLVAARTAAAADTAAAWFRLAEAYDHVLLHEPQAALDLLNRTIAENPQLQDFVARSPWFVALHGDPGFVRPTSGPND